MNLALRSDTEAWQEFMDAWQLERDHQDCDCLELVEKKPAPLNASAHLLSPQLQERSDELDVPEWIEPPQVYGELEHLETEPLFFDGVGSPRDNEDFLNG